MPPQSSHGTSDIMMYTCAGWETGRIRMHGNTKITETIIIFNQRLQSHSTIYRSGTMFAKNDAPSHMNGSNGMHLSVGQ